MDNIRTIMVKDILKVDNITQGSSWKDLLDYIENNIDKSEQVMLDFKQINVIEPWTIEEFCSLLRMENIYFKFTSYNKQTLEQFINRIKTRCILEGLSPDRVQAVYLEPKKVKTREEIALENDADFFVDNFVVSATKDSAYINMESIYSQIGSSSTINALVLAVINMNKDFGIAKFTVKTGRMFIQSNIIELISKKVLELDKKYGIELNIDTDIEDTAQKLGLYLHTALNQSFTLRDKIIEFDKLAKNTPCMLVKYKKSRAIDEFGRNGKGQVVSNRIALYKGLCIKDGYTSIKIIRKVLEIDSKEVRAEVEYKLPNGQRTLDVAWFELTDVAAIVYSYNNNKFMTQAEWLSRYDNQIVDSQGKEIVKLPYDREIVHIEDIGLMDLFLGKKYHILEPVQHSKEENMRIVVDINDEGFNVYNTVTIPERIKTVLEDWGESYDKESLQRYIQKTKEVLAKQE